MSTRLRVVLRHGGPGIHDTGKPQSVHNRYKGSSAESYQTMIGRPSYQPGQLKLDSAREYGEIVMAEVTTEEQIKRLGWWFEADVNPLLHILAKDGIAGIQQAGIERMQEVLDTGDVAIRVQTSALERIISDGHIKNQFEVDGSNGTFDPVFRKQAEMNGMGTPDDLGGSGRVTYGYVSSPKLMASPEPGARATNAKVSEYGNFELVLNDDIKPRTTVVVGDSLDGMSRGQLVAAPYRVAAQEPSCHGGAYTAMALNLGGGRGISYYETQIHGGVRISDIKHVVVHGLSPDDSTSQWKRDIHSAVQSLRSKGIEVVYSKDTQ